MLTRFLVACPLLRMRAYFVVASPVRSRDVQCSSKLPAAHEPLRHSVAFMLMLPGIVFWAHVAAKGHILLFHGGGVTGIEQVNESRLDSR